MKALMAIALREVQDRWTILALALALGFLPLLAQTVGAKGADIPAIAAIVVGSLTLLVALMTGASVIGRDLAEGRLGFLFARPIPWWAIWGGKMSAALCLTVASAVLASLPAALWYRGPRHFVEGLWQARAAALLLAGAVLVIALSHNLSVAYRSRSPWILLDLAGCALVFFAAMATLGDASPALGLLPPPSMWPPLAALLAVPLLASGAAQVAAGRIDPRRGYRALSLTLWAVVAPAALGVASFAAYARTASPADLLEVESAMPSPQGTWVLATGPVERGLTYRAHFLVDTATGRYVSLGQWFGLSCVGFSSDGRRAAWGRERGEGRTNIFTMASGETEPVRLASAPERVLDCAVSPDGRRVATVTRRAVTFFDASASRPPVSVTATIDGHLASVVYFDEGLRLITVPDPGMGEAVLHEVTEAGTRVAGPLTGTTRLLQPLWSRSGASLLVRDSWRIAFPGRLTLHDGATGQRLATLLESPAGEGGEFSPGFLADGRVVVAEAGPREARLRVFAPDGREVGSVALGAQARAATFASEITPGVAAVGLWKGTTHRSTEIVLCEIDQGRVLRREAGLRPTFPPYRFAEARCVPGSEGCRIFVSEDGDLVRLDPATGDRKVLLAVRR